MKGCTQFTLNFLNDEMVLEINAHVEILLQMHQYKE